MILKFFKRGTGNTKSGESVQNYLLDDERQEKEQATVLRGDPALTTAIINGLDFSKTYTSGCLSFAANEGEQLTDQQKNEMMDSFEQALFADFERDKVNGYWVQHKDKDRLELNFVFANVELEKGRSLTVYNHATDRKRLYAWKNITIADYDLIDPDHPDRKRDFVAVTPSNEKKKKKDNDLAPATTKGKINLTKQGIGEYLLSQAQQAKINNRDDVMAFLRDTLKVEITRETKNSITIQTPHLKTGKPQKIRLEGSLYERDFTATTTNPNYRAERARNYDQQYTQRINELRKMYHNLTKYKSERLRERYKRDKARADELARKRYQQDDQREREPIKQHSEPTQARTSEYIREHTEPRSKNAISPCPTNDSGATGISETHQTELSRTATADKRAEQSPIDPSHAIGRSGITFGAYLPSGFNQHNDMVASSFNSNDSIDNHDSFNSLHLQTDDRNNRERVNNERDQPTSKYDLKSIIRDLARSATASLSEYATAINEHINDIKERATDSISELTTASDQQQRTIRELIEQAGAVTATTQQIILEREKEPAPPAPQPAPTPSEQQEKEKDNKKDDLAPTPAPAKPSPSPNHPRLR